VARWAAEGLLDVALGAAREGHQAVPGLGGVLETELHAPKPAGGPIMSVKNLKWALERAYAT
jgi:hypothetical protein